MAERLTFALAEEKMGRQMHGEDEIERTIVKLVREKDAITQEKEAALWESREELAQKTL